MSLKFIIRNVTDAEIEFFGDADELDKAKDIFLGCIIHEGKTIDWEAKTNPTIYPSFNLSLYNLYHQIKERWIPQVILKCIDDNKINTLSRDSYLLQYWDYEVKMIVSGKSKHKLFKVDVPPHLSSPILLNAVLNECEKKKYLPGFEQLFQFFEESEKILGSYLNPMLYFCKPFKLNTKEVQKFIKRNENNLFIDKENKVSGNYQLLLFDKKLTKVDNDYYPKNKDSFNLKGNI